MDGPQTTTSTVDRLLIDLAQFSQLLAILKDSGYEVVGPTIEQESIVYGPLDSTDDLPVGWTDEQKGGEYRLKKRDDGALFGYSLGPHSWKKYLFPPSLRLMQLQRDGDGFQVLPQTPESTKFAFIGMRSCEIHAMAIQDKVLTGGSHADPHYKAIRERVFVVAVNCGQAGGTCFCVSMDTGPKATFGYDLALTEILEGDNHSFVVHVGTENGRQVMNQIAPRTAEEDEVRAADDVVAETARNMGRTMDTTNIKDLLYRNLDNPQWDEVASRCLSCANCTMVCPTCFCTTVEDTTDLTGDHAERWRHWDSCFSLDFSYIHGGNVRSSAKSRYRQWMTHKLATWTDQFGTSGCVGCGRCISWCPVSIDITQEVQSIRESESSESNPPDEEATT